uniref:transmembrane protein 220-like n=1 Tax=Styela clava TaxID=7725 RepID=UPI001939394C
LLTLALVIFRILNFIAASFFILSAFVQYNDPDPELWIPVYLAPAIISELIGFKPSLSESKIHKRIIFMHETSHLSVKNWLSSVFIWIPIAMWIYVYNNQECRELWPQHCQTALYPESYPPREES